MVYVTRGLLAVLLDFAREAEPEDVSAVLVPTAAGDLEFDGRSDLPPETPVFTDFYLPDTGRSVSNVFGVDLSTPLGQTRGRFVSHPRGDHELSRTDDLAAVVFVAVPPWDRSSVYAYDRRGRRQELTVLDAKPGEEATPDSRGL